MKSEKNTKTGRIYGIDALRAFAITGVFFYHLCPGVLRGGFLGVDLFFMLTGFLLAVTGLQKIDNGTFNLKKYYLTRLLRIYPPLLITVAGSSIFFIFAIPESIEKLNREFAGIFFSFNNWWRIAQHASYFAKMSSQSPFTHLWFLSLEMQYYIVWPLLLLIFVSAAEKISRKKAAYFFFFAALLSFALMAVLYRPSSDVSRIYYGTDTRAFSILFGAFTGALYSAGEFRSWPFTGLDNVWKLFDGTTDAAVRGIEKKNNRIHKRHPFTEFIILALAVLVLYFAVPGQSAFTYRGGLLLSDLIFMLLLGLSCQKPLYIGSFLESTPFTFTGKISYEIYLVHYPVIYYFKQKIPFKNSIISGLAAMAVTFVLALILHFIIGTFFKPYTGKDAERTQNTRKTSHSENINAGHMKTDAGQSRGHRRQNKTYNSEYRKHGKVRRRNFRKGGAVRNSGRRKYSTAKYSPASGSGKLFAGQLIRRAFSNRFTWLLICCVLAVNICGEISIHSDAGKDSRMVENELKKNSKLIEENNEHEQSSKLSKNASGGGTSAASSGAAAEKSPVKKHRITIIGDSVMLSAVPALREEFPHALIDARVSRQLVQCTGIIKHYKSTGELGKAVIIGLGTNGPFTQSQGQELVDAIGSRRIIYWVNTYGKTLSWQGEVNRMIAALARENKNIHVIDWASLAVSHPEWFYNDGIHLKPSGQPAYAKLISKSVDF